MRKKLNLSTWSSLPLALQVLLAILPGALIMLISYTMLAMKTRTTEMLYGDLMRYEEQYQRDMINHKSRERMRNEKYLMENVAMIMRGRYFIDDIVEGAVLLKYLKTERLQPKSLKVHGKTVQVDHRKVAKPSGPSDEQRKGGLYDEYHCSMIFAGNRGDIEKILAAFAKIEKTMFATDFSIQATSDNRGRQMLEMVIHDAIVMAPRKNEGVVKQRAIPITPIKKVL